MFSRMARMFVYALAVCMMCSGAAHAFCTEPRAGFGMTAPPPPSYERPDVPDCLARRGSGGGVLNCDDYELRDYRDKAERYEEKLDEYAAASNIFAEKAARYAEEAADYAACEQRELKGE